MTNDMEVGNKSFHLRWNNHLENLRALFECLFNEQILVDVTIACQDGLLRVSGEFLCCKIRFVLSVIICTSTVRIRRIVVSYTLLSKLALACYIHWLIISLKHQHHFRF